MKNSAGVLGPEAVQKVSAGLGPAASATATARHSVEAPKFAEGFQSHPADAALQTLAQ